jgi:hypothetical protein
MTEGRHNRRTLSGLFDSSTDAEGIAQTDKRHKRAVNAVNAVT